MKHSIRLLFLLMAFPLFGACDKSGEQNPPEDETLTLLTQGPWTSMEYWLDQGGNGNYVRVSEACDEDNQWIFNTDGTYEISDSTLRCDPNGGVLSVVNKWALKNNNSVLSLIYEMPFLSTDDFDIVSITSNRLEIVSVGTALPIEKYVLKR